MRYEPLPSSFFAGNREELASRLPAGSMLILHANDVFPTNADGTFALHQNANLFYLTGVDQEETVLVMTIREGGWDEILLLRETNEQIAIWEGARLSQEQARELSGIQDVRWTDEYDALLEALVPSASMVFVEANQHPRCTCPVETRNARMTKELKEKFPDAVLKNVYEIMADMRQIKKPEEIKALKKACDITNEGFRELLRFIRWANGRLRDSWPTNSSAAVRANSPSCPSSLPERIPACCIISKTTNGAKTAIWCLWI